MFWWIHGTVHAHFTKKASSKKKILMAPRSWGLMICSLNHHKFALIQQPSHVFYRCRLIQLWRKHLKTRRKTQIINKLSKEKRKRKNTDRIAATLTARQVPKYSAVYLPIWHPWTLPAIPLSRGHLGKAFAETGLALIDWFQWTRGRLPQAE